MAAAGRQLLDTRGSARLSKFEQWSFMMVEERVCAAAAGHERPTSSRSARWQPREMEADADELVLAAVARNELDIDVVCADKVASEDHNYIGTIELRTGLPSVLAKSLSVWTRASFSTSRLLRESSASRSASSSPKVSMRVWNASHSWEEREAPLNIIFITLFTAPPSKEKLRSRASSRSSG